MGQSFILDAITKELLTDFRMTLRQVGDIGHERQKPTAQPSAIQRRIQAFKEKWANIEIAEAPALSAETLEAIGNLLRHVEKGCLSEVPAGCGTNRNERLHRNLNSSALNMPHCGPRLANAILNLLVYAHNCKIDSPSATVKPIWTYANTFCTSMTPFDEHIPNTTPQTNLPDLIESQMCSTAQHQGQITEIHTCLHNLVAMHKSLKEQFNTPLINICKSTILLGYGIDKCGRLLLEADKEELDRRVQDFELHTVEINELKTCNDSKCGRLAAAEELFRVVLQHSTESDLIVQLQVLVEHQGICLLLVSGQQQTLVFPFVPQTKAQQCECILFFSVYYISNEMLAVQIYDTVPTTHALLGHEASSTDHGRHDNWMSCRCGEKLPKTSSQQLACCNTVGQYATRCKCYKAKVACSQCTCHNCGNPFGLHGSESPPTKQPRMSRRSSSRPSHATVKATNYLSGKGVDELKTRFSDMESVALLLVHFQNLSKDRSGKDRVTSTIMYEQYQLLQETCVQSNCHTRLTAKRESQVSAKYNQLLKVISTVISIIKCD